MTESSNSTSDSTSTSTSSQIEPLPDGEPQRIAKVAIEEDLDGGVDVTTEATIAQDAEGTGLIVARADGVLAGLPVAQAVADHFANLLVRTRVADGDRVERGQVIAEVSGRIQQILVAERNMLNVLTLASGIATLTARWVQAVDGTGAVIRDTRKTAPGLRALQKYAVRCGGGMNHRMSLSDQALIKDNHVLAAGGVVPALKAVREMSPNIICEVECTEVEQVEQACRAGAELVLLDNMSLDQMRASVEIARRYQARTEASGGLRLENAREVAETGVDYLAIGALTHSAPALDIALDLIG